MTLGKLISYIERYQSGELFKDVAYRAYDIMHGAGDRRLKLALKKAGIHHAETQNGFDECKAKLRAFGFNISDFDLEQCLLGWYVWQRINDGELRRWKKR